MKTRVLGFAALAAIIGAAINGLFIVPADLNQGDAQRIMYVHVASAWLAYASFGVTAVAGLGYLVWRDLRLDALALAGAEVGVMFTAFAIWGGMMWGKPVWGVYWQWEDPRLTTTALLLALYVGYLLLRRMTDDPARRAARAAVVGLIAAAPLVLRRACRIGLSTRFGRVSFPVPATHCQLPTLLARSPSTRSRSK